MPGAATLRSRKPIVCAVRSSITRSWPKAKPSVMKSRDSEPVDTASPARRTLVMELCMVKLSLSELPEPGLDTQHPQ